MAIKYTRNPFLLAIISGVLCILSFPPFNLSFLIWVALIPLIYAIVITPYEKKKIFGITYYVAPLIGFIFGLVFYVGTLYWIYNVFGLFGFLLILILCIYPYIFSYLLNYSYHKLNKEILIIFLPVILWTAIEFIKSEPIWLKFTWMNLGYTQHNFLPILQFANIFGQYGLTALILIVNSIIVYILINQNNRKNIAKSIIALTLIFLFVLSYGFIQLNTKYSPNVTVVLIQDESSEFSVYNNLISEIIENVNFILLPEYALIEYLNENEDRLNQIKNITNQYDSYFIVGSKYKVNNSKGLGYYNTAYLFNPNGVIIGKYNKMNPIQFFNDGDPGKEFSVFDSKYGKVGILICYDMDYSYVARNIVKNGAEFLFIPTYDAMRWSEVQHKQHSAMTSMRAVENGRFIARTASSGISQIIDPNGRTTQEIEIGKSDIAIGSIQQISNQTLYTKMGFLLPFFCIILSLILVFISIFKKR
jgi:apolipoprotein N-acyltransferase